MSQDLPAFRHVPPEYARAIAEAALTHPGTEATSLHDLIGYEDGHYRAVFALDYFGEDAPSKSQWNNLKKRFKRHHPGVFVFKETGITQQDEATYGYLEFGFFLD